MLEVGKRLLRPILQFVVVAPLGITCKEGDRAFVSADLHGIVFAAKIRGRGGVQFVDLFLKRAVGRRRQSGLNIAAGNQGLQLSARLGVVSGNSKSFAGTSTFGPRNPPRENEPTMQPF